MRLTYSDSTFGVFLFALFFSWLPHGDQYQNFVRELCPDRDNASIPEIFLHKYLRIEFCITLTPHFSYPWSLGYVGKELMKVFSPNEAELSPAPAQAPDWRNNQRIELCSLSHKTCLLTFLPLFKQLVLSSCCLLKSNLVPNISERMLATPFNKRQIPLTTFDFVLVTLIMVNSFSTLHDCCV